MKSDRGSQIIENAKDMGASIAGIASVEQLKKSPSHRLLRKFGTKVDGVYSFEMIKDFNEIEWPEKAKSALVIGFYHPEDEPELDWSNAAGNTPGNRILQKINMELSAWIEETMGIKTHKMPYWVEEGGIYLKDTAVLGGLGCIGKNNLLLTPEFGSSVRLRAMLLEDELTPTGPITFNPCDNCDEFCRTACPQNAFDRIVLSFGETGLDTLPGRDGCFSRGKCSQQMDNDFEDSGIIVEEGFLSEKNPAVVEAGGISQTSEGIKWCRQCELACPIGR